MIVSAGIRPHAEAFVYDFESRYSYRAARRSGGLFQGFPLLESSLPVHSFRVPWFGIAAQSLTAAPLLRLDRCSRLRGGLFGRARPLFLTPARAALSGTQIIDEGRYYCGPHHHRRCHYANARADDGACATGNESSSTLASNNADYGFRRNRATHERERQSYYRNNLHF